MKVLSMYSPFLVLSALAILSGCTGEACWGEGDLNKDSFASWIIVPVDNSDSGITAKIWLEDVDTLDGNAVYYTYYRHSSFAPAETDEIMGSWAAASGEISYDGCDSDWKLEKARVWFKDPSDTEKFIDELESIESP